MIFSWLKKRFTRPSRVPAPTRPTRYQPTLEGLEQRQVLSVANQNFVKHVYQDLLARAPETSAQTALTNLLDAGSVTRQQLIAGVEVSLEFRTNLAQTFYFRFLGRAGDPVGLVNSTIFFGNGGSVVQYKSSMTASQEYFNGHGGSNSSFLSSLYLDALGRAIDTPTLSSLTTALNNGVSRQAICNGVWFSQEANQYQENRFYVSLLGRNSDPTGQATFANQMFVGVPEQIVAAEIMSSQEYYNRP